MIKSIIFDFDGTIVDTEEHAYLTWREIFEEEYGVELPLQLWVRCIGGGDDSFDPIHYLQDQIGRPVDRAALTARQREIYTQKAYTLPLRSGVKEYLEEARELGLKIGLASSSNRAWVESHLERRGLLPYFDELSTRDDVRRVKPDPELFMAAMRGLDISGEEGLVIEDSRNGLAAAKASGLYCLVVPCSLTKNLDFHEADLELDSLADASLNTVIGMLYEKRLKGSR